MCPDGLEDALFDPPLHRAVDGGVVGEFLGQTVPLYARANPIDDGVEGRPLIDASGTRIERRIEFEEYRLDAEPEFVG